MKFAPLAVLATGMTFATAAFAEPEPVNAFNFVRAETDTYLASLIAENGLGVLSHNRALTSLDEQTVIRMNLDTLYSWGVYDLAAGPVTVAVLEPADGRYVAVEVLSQDHYSPVVIHSGTHTLTEKSIGTRYLALLGRTFVDPNDPADLEAAHAAQDGIAVEQASVGAFEMPEWDKTSLDATRQALLALAALGMEGGGRSMGTKEEVDPLRHLLATAAGWGLNPETEAIYITTPVAQADGETIHRMSLRDVPVDGFWSISVYNSDGFFEPNDLGINSVNDVTGTPGEDGAYEVQFGGCDGAVSNCVPITEGWNYLLRLYQPRAEVIDGTWQAPVPVPMN